CDAVVRCTIEWRRQLTGDRKERAEDVANRLTEAFGGVLHPGVEAPEPAIPGRGTSHSTMIEEPDGEDREDHDRGDGEKENECGIGGLPPAQGHEEPPR